MALILLMLQSVQLQKQMTCVDRSGRMAEVQGEAVKEVIIDDLVPTLHGSRGLYRFRDPQWLRRLGSLFELDSRTCTS